MSTEYPNHTHTLHIIARDRTAIVERILRVIRHRGFQLQGLSLPVIQDGFVRMSVTVMSDRPAQQLHLQLNKLVDVFDVQQDSLSLAALDFCQQRSSA